MNTRIYMILETLLVSFRMIKRILKEHRGISMEVKGSFGSFTKKKKTTPNKGTFRNGIRNKA